MGRKADEPACGGDSHAGELKIARNVAKPGNCREECFYNFLILFPEKRTRDIDEFPSRFDKLSIK